MHTRLILPCLLLLCLWQPAFGKTGEAPGDIASEKRSLCDHGTMLDMSQCIHRELRESDARLNLVYQALMKALAEPRPLQKAQRAWLAFRDAQCAFDSEALKGGSARPYSLKLCLIVLAEQRIAALEQVQPCNGCVLFKDEFYGRDGFRLPKRAFAPSRAPEQ